MPDVLGEGKGDTSLNRTNYESFWSNLRQWRTEMQREQERKFTSDLNKSLDSTDDKTLGIIKIEDRAFLLSQRELGRRGCLYANRYEAFKA
ncbi:hypothetical protein AVEN_56761-1 [Araneus ventricosus]|uniref:Uncharacterized protein n=1 Tax=Araneus ventricosus TaxID=182803 RepID=A0A4Y2EX78_ARAVE|nr:hypothetical protein AVEN_56761-1 [Araneus ventricosus]